MRGRQQGGQTVLSVEGKDSSIQRLVTAVYQRVPPRQVLLEDPAPDDPYVITFVQARDGAEICTVRTEGNEPGQYDIIDATMRVPHCLIQGVVWKIKNALRRKR